MAISYSLVRNKLTAKRFERALLDDGFYLDHQRGSHKVYFHADGRRVVLTYHHPSDTFKTGTLKGMVENDAQWTEADLRRLKVIK